MPLRKILVYGGCHALVLRDLMIALFPEDIDATLVINFDIIRRGLPFPFERLKEFDVVIYSPIENKGDYNTVHLAQACQTLGVDAICFPWPEWHAYCPGATKGGFKNRFQWYYGDLVRSSLVFNRFEEFADWAIAAYPEDDIIDSVFARSTEMVSGAEERHSANIHIADFILEHYRDTRLFLISDHPSLSLYLHMLRQILELIGLPGAVQLGRAANYEEPQGRWRTPVFPRVAERLGLRFRDEKWVDDEVVPGRTIDLLSYLRLYYHAESAILGPIDNAAILHIAANSAVQRVDVMTRLIADKLEACGDDFREEYRLIEVLSGKALPVKLDQHFEINKTQWRSVWS